MIEIMEETRYKCPVCGHLHSSRELAEECAKAADFRKKFMETAKPYHWYLLADKYSARMIMPYKIVEDYSWGSSYSCKKRGVSLFPLFSNSYYDIYDLTPELEKLPERCEGWICGGIYSIREAFEKYFIVPPLMHLDNPRADIPEEVKADFDYVAQKGLELRKNEIRNMEFSLNDMIDRRARVDCAAFLPKCPENVPSKIITGQSLYNLDPSKLPDIKAKSVE